MSSLYERRFHKSRLLSKPTAILALRFFWVIVVIWCEVGVFFYSLSDCRWPDKALQPAGSPSRVKPTRVLLLADARLRRSAVSALNSWFWYDPNLAYIRKSWRLVSRLSPNVVMLLGDTFASGRYLTSETEYDQYFRAFEATFPHDPSVGLYLIPGNNDIGLGDSSSFSKDARRLFEEHFGPLNRVVSISGHQFVLLNAPGLVEEDYHRHAHGQTYEHWEPLPGGPIEFVQSISSDQENGYALEPKILLTHIPLSRPSGKSCGPLREKGSIRAGARRGYQAMLGKQTTEFLLKMLRPSVVFSGDNRDYCEVTHEISSSDAQASTVREVTVKSFSRSRHIRRPGFQLLSLVPPSSSLTGPTFADAPCHLPDTLHVFHSIYIPCLVLTTFVLLYLNIGILHHRRRFSNLSPMSLTYHKRSSLGHEPESAIWTTRTPFKSRVPTSPTGALPSSARIPSTKPVASYRASPIVTPQDSPLLSPITLFPSGDEGDLDEDYMSPSHYGVRRHLHYHNGWQGEHDHHHDDDSVVARVRDRDRGPAPDRPHPHPHSHARTASAPYFLPPPSSQHARARWSWSWSFVFRGRRRRMTIGVPEWKKTLAWRSWLSASAGRRRERGRGPGRGLGRRRGLALRFVSDCVSVALPAVGVLIVISWSFS